MRWWLRTAALWGGCTMCVLIVVAFVASVWLQFAYQRGGVCAILKAGIVVTGADHIGARCFYVSRHSSELTVSMTFPYFGSSYIIIPLYAVFVAVAVPTFLVWRFGPKPVKPGHCRCGYDLTGNQSGKCPECGVEVQR